MKKKRCPNCGHKYFEQVMVACSPEIVLQEARIVLHSVITEQCQHCGALVMIDEPDADLKLSASMKITLKDIEKFVVAEMSKRYPDTDGFSYVSGDGDDDDELPF